MYNEGFGLSADKNPRSSAAYSVANPVAPGYGRGEDEIQTIIGKDFEDCRQNHLCRIAI